MVSGRDCHACPSGDSEKSSNLPGIYSYIFVDAIFYVFKFSNKSLIFLKTFLYFNLNTICFRNAKKGDGICKQLEMNHVKLF